MDEEALVRRLEACLGYRIEGSSIVVENKCGEPLRIVALEIEYLIYIPRASVNVPEHVELGHLRKRVVERISVDMVVEPDSDIRVYFGAPRNLEAVFAVVGKDSREYRVRLTKAKEEKRAEA